VAPSTGKGGHQIGSTPGPVGGGHHRMGAAVIALSAETDLMASSLSTAHIPQPTEWLAPRAVKEALESNLNGGALVDYPLAQDLCLQPTAMHQAA
jgi:hypothetical protein